MKLEPTPSQTVGPFFHYALLDEDLSQLVAPDHPSAIRIGGTVRDGAGEVVPDAMLEIWQADADGRYDNPEFLGWGRAATDAHGVFRFLTIRPGASAGRAAHINFVLLYSGLMRQLHTVMFFDQSDDAVLNAVQDRKRLIAKQEGNRFVFDIRLRGEGETPFFDD
jgi:protocatechuate 3,4-dioxygenase, alpha subunit